jgi:type IV pilus assembly protein PilB
LVPRGKRKTQEIAPATLFGEFMEQKGLVDRAELARALSYQQEHGGMLGQVAVSLGLVDEREIAAALSEYLGIPLADLRRETISPDAKALVDESFAREHALVPLRVENGSLFVAMADPRDRATLDTLERRSQRTVHPLVASRSDIARAIGGAYTTAGEVKTQAAALQDLVAGERAAVDATPELETAIQNAPAVQIVNLVLTQGLRDRASDIHLEPQANNLRVRFRVDGTLQDIARLPSEIAAPLVSRIKIMADLNIVERHLPQDGRLEITIDGNPVDVRVSTTETLWGEKVVMRLLPKNRELLTLEQLGMPEADRQMFRKMTRSPFGMIVIAGPTGSGKTTTLYATLAELDRGHRNIVTIEDPVEYVFEDINQIQIRPQVGITFASGLKSILRQDPDVMLVGEIRDVETARIAVQSALTGHFVMSSIHATDSVAALMRFLDMGIEPFLVSAALVGIGAQRLLRRVCSHCVEPATLTPEEADFYKAFAGHAPRRKLSQGAGCNFCSGTGFLGRVVVFELLRVSETIKQLVLEGASYEELRDLAIAEGLVPLRKSALRQVDEGATTVGEVMRTLYEAT